MNNSNKEKSKMDNDASKKQSASIDKESISPIDESDSKMVEVSDSKDSGLSGLNKVASDIASASHKSSEKSPSHGPSVDNTHKDFKRKGHFNGYKHHDKQKDNHGGRKNVIKPEKATEPIAPIEAQLGAFFNLRSDRTVSEYTKPTAASFSLLGFTHAANGVNWQIVNNIRQLNYSNANGINTANGNPNYNYTENAKNTMAAVNSINDLMWNHRPYAIGVAQLFDNAYTQGFISTEQRTRETDCSILNYFIRPTIVNPIEAFRQQGMVNSFYPYSSLPSNFGTSLPLTPHQVDDIMLFSLDGGAFLKSSNMLVRTPSDLFAQALGYDCYLLPGIPGFNHYESQQQIDDGTLRATHLDARKYVDRQFIYDGDYGTSSHSTWQALVTEGIVAAATSTTTNNPKDSIVHFAHDYNDIWDEVTSNLRSVNQTQNESNFMTFPDYNYAVIQSDFKKLFRAMRALVQANLTDSMWGQLSGMTDEQAFYNAVQSAIHFGTFFRILLIAVGKTWKNGAFVKSKVGQLCYNDGILRNIPPQRFDSALAFLDCMASAVLPYLPYNKYSVENFKLWFDVSMSSRTADPFAENNAAMALRSIFCGMSDFMKTMTPLSNTGTDKYRNYDPHDYAEEVNSHIAKAAGDLKSLLTDITKNGHVDNVWGYRVKSLDRQTSLFVPHGDALANFFARFKSVFTIRPWTETGKDDPIGDSLTMMMDPMNFTGFVANFFAHNNLVSNMIGWALSYIDLVRAFFIIVKAIGDNSATIHFDEHVDWDRPQFNPPLLVPGYKQHIIDYFQDTPRLLRFNVGNRKCTETDIINLTSSGTVACLSGHRPTKGFATPSDTVGITGLTTALQHVSLPRLGLNLPRNSQYYDFGTAGTQLYNVSNPWATAARPYADNPVASTASNLSTSASQLLKDNKYSGYFLSGSDISEPFDLYRMFWYPSFWHMPYYPLKNTVLTPGYEWPLPDKLFSTGTEDSNGVTLGEINETSWNNGYQVSLLKVTTTRIKVMAGFAYDYVDVVYDGAGKDQSVLGREYRELFSIRRDSVNTTGTSVPEFSVASTCLRLTYGSGNTNLLWGSQFVVPNIPGYHGRDVLSTRQNAVSIFTAYNARCWGLPTTRNNVQYSQTTDGEALYREVIQDNFSKSLGIPYLPFLSVSNGASLWFDQLLTCVPSFAERATSSDIDLSTRYFNLLSNIAALQCGDVDGEAYPSSDGWGTDQLAHPEKMNKNEWYSNFIKSMSSKQEQVYSGKSTNNK